MAACIVKECHEEGIMKHTIAGSDYNACEKHADEITVLLLEYCHDDLQLRQKVYFTIRNLGHREGGEAG